MKVLTRASLGGQVHRAVLIDESVQLVKTEAEAAAVVMRMRLAEGNRHLLQHVCVLYICTHLRPACAHCTQPRPLLTSLRARRPRARYWPQRSAAQRSATFTSQHQLDSTRLRKERKPAENYNNDAINSFL